MPDPDPRRSGHARGYWATCNRDRGALGWPDSALHPVVIAEDAVFFTNNEVDFVVLCRRVDLHPGLVTIPQVARREHQWPLFHAVLDHVERAAAAAGQPPREWMVNRHVEVAPEGAVTDSELP